MAKVEITKWGELAIMEKLLDDYCYSVSSKKDPRVDHAKALLERVRPALMQATEELV